jgi:hypothetical protein
VYGICFIYGSKEYFPCTVRVYSVGRIIYGASRDGRGTLENRTDLASRGPDGREQMSYFLCSFLHSNYHASPHVQLSWARRLLCPFLYSLWSLWWRKVAQYNHTEQSNILNNLNTHGFCLGNVQYFVLPWEVCSILC